MLKLFKKTMRKNKFYIITFILTIILIFSTAFTLNLCGMPVEIETEEEEEAAPPEDVETKPSGPPEEEEEVVEEAAPEEEVSGEAEVAEKEEEKTPPTIELKIYEGPTYSAADDVCFYRVEAIVTGNPTPTVSFSRDDSGGAWGSKKVQINLKRNSPTYTLTATATNSEGSDSDSITLSWGCGEEGFFEGEAEPEEGVSPEPGNHPPVITEAYVEPSTMIVGEIFTVYIKGDDRDGDDITFEAEPIEEGDWETLSIIKSPNKVTLTAKGWQEGTYHFGACARDEHGAVSELSYFTLEILPIPKVNEPIYIPSIPTIPTLVNQPPVLSSWWTDLPIVNIVNNIFTFRVPVGDTFKVSAEGGDPDGDIIIFQLTPESGLEPIRSSDDLEPIVWQIYKAKLPGDYIKTVYLTDEYGAKSNSYDFILTIVP